MSTGTSLPWGEAYGLAEQAAKLLLPHVVRLKAVGNLRRRRPYVGDLEFLAESRMEPSDLFGSLAPDVAPIRKVFEELGTWVKGGERMMQITNFYGLPGLKLEVYLCWKPASWGALLGIRTGPWELGRHVMTAIKGRGYGHAAGHAFSLDTREPVATPDEAEWFGLAGLPLIAPNLRDEFAVQCGSMIPGVGR